LEIAKEVCERLNLPYSRAIPVSGLTLAMMKRLELARALATQPVLLLLDEMMAGLNQKETVEIIDVVRNIQTSGVTVLLIEHVMQAVMSLSDRIVVLSFGQKIAEGKPAAIVRDPRVVDAYLGGQSNA
ncbi:MAG: ABC transporter ATP-binding protein, partial [Deltaproteobacteria bacterium]|nr:ABC transporter ATP-binding protein [Deltaproteobacteria bacterium]